MAGEVPDANPAVREMQHRPQRASAKRRNVAVGPKEG
jgi:hypothetical protein